MQKKYWKQINFWLVSLLVTGAIGTGIFYYLNRDRKSVSISTNQGETIFATTESIAVEIEANGTVQPIDKINLSPQESGKIVYLYVNEGDRVQKGQSIAKMDDRALQAQLRQYRAAATKAKAELAEKLAGNRRETIAEAEAKIEVEAANVTQAKVSLESATEEVKRYQLLVSQGAISRIDLDKAIAQQKKEASNLKAAEAQKRQQEENLKLLKNGSSNEEIERAKANLAEAEAQVEYYLTQLEQTLIHAPFSGTITRLFARVGDFVTPTTTASTAEGSISTSIAELASGLEIEAKIPETSLAAIRVGQKVEIALEADSSLKLRGKVRSIAPTAVKQDNLTFFRVKIDFDVPNSFVMAGMNAKLIFLVGQIEKATVIPLAAIVTEKDGATGVFVPDKLNGYQWQPVTVGKTTKDRIQILEGLQAGDRLFLSPPDDRIIDGVDNLENN